MHVIQDGRVIDRRVFFNNLKDIPKYNFLCKIFKTKPLFFLLITMRSQLISCFEK